MRLDLLVKALFDVWETSLSVEDYFHSVGDGVYYRFGVQGAPPSLEQSEVYDKMQRAAEQMHQSWQALLAYIRENYVEIDLEQSSKDAWAECVVFCAKNEELDDPD